MKATARTTKLANVERLNMRQYNTSRVSMTGTFVLVVGRTEGGGGGLLDSPFGSKKDKARRRAIPPSLRPLLTSLQASISTPLANNHTLPVCCRYHNIRRKTRHDMSLR